MVRYVHGLITGFLIGLGLLVTVENARRLAELEDALDALGELDPTEVQRRVEGREL